MRSYWGRIDLDRLPPEHIVRGFQARARELYKQNKNKTTLTRERFIMDATWNMIADYQEGIRAEEQAGRVC